jgi:hypothetical protein
LDSKSQDNVERLARLEVKMENVEEYLYKIDAKLDAWTMNFPNRAEIEEKFKQRDMAIESLWDEFKFLEENVREKRRLTPAWIATIISMVGLIIGFLLRR